MYKTFLMLIMTTLMVSAQANPVGNYRLQNVLHSENIFTREEGEALVNESQSYGTTCDSMKHPSTVRLPVYASSLCPWYYELSHQPGLFPSTVLRAKLRCDNGESPCKRLSPRDYTCVYIRRGVRMFNTTCQGRGCEFIQNVRFGAQCIRTHSLHG